MSGKSVSRAERTGQPAGPVRAPQPSKRLQRSAVASPMRPGSQSLKPKWIITCFADIVFMR